MVALLTHRQHRRLPGGSHFSTADLHATRRAGTQLVAIERTGITASSPAV
jgi:hypothetical protein